MSAKKILLILFLPLFALGFCIIGAGLCHSAHMQEKNCSAMAEGRVIEDRKNSYIGQKRMFTPIMEYQVENEIFTGETNVWHSSRLFERGEYVMIGYNPTNPEEFYIKSYNLNMMARLGILFLVIGGAILVITVTVVILDKNKMDKEKKEKIQTDRYVIVARSFFESIPDEISFRSSHAGVLSLYQQEFGKGADGGIGRT